MCRLIYNEFKEQIKFYEPLPSFDDQFPNRLESILSSVAQTFDGHHLYPTVFDASAAYYYKITCGHAFTNGNKRLGIIFTHIFLRLHGLDFTIPQKTFYVLTEKLVSLSQQGEKQSVIEQIARQIIIDYTEEKNPIV